MKTFLYILLLSFGFYATAQSSSPIQQLLDEGLNCGNQLEVSDNNMAVIFGTGLLDDFAGHSLFVVAKKVVYTNPADQYNGVGPNNVYYTQVSECVEIQQGGLGVVIEGSVDYMNYILDYASPGDELIFVIITNDETIIMIDVMPSLTYAMNSFIIIDEPSAVSLTLDGAPVFFGCADAAYLEFDASANLDDGSCTVLVVEGCMDATACNFDSGANTSDESCLFYGCTDPAYYEFDENATCDDGSCVINLAAESFNSIQYSCGETITSYEYNNTQIYGLQENDIFKLKLNIDQENCYWNYYDEFAFGLYEGDYYGYIYNNNVYAGIYIDNNLEYVFESNSNAEINEILLQGANSYTIIFTQYYPAYHLAGNEFNEYISCQPFSMSIKKYDSTCYLSGCTDSLAINYLIGANIDNGSCEYPTNLGNLECGLETIVSGNTSSSYGLQNSAYYSLEIENDSEMIINIDGTPSMYDPYILLFDSSQVYMQTISYTQSYYINDYPLELDAGEYYITVTENHPNFNGSSLADYYTEMQDNSQSTGSFTLSFFVNDGICDLLGCTYYWADNYNELATIDNGSCYLNGCTSANANNYNPYATQDNGTCSYINTINFGVLECGETYHHKNEFTSLNSVQYEFHLNTRSIIQIDYNEQGGYCLQYNYIGDCISSSLGHNEFSISLFDSTINDWVIVENYLDNSFDLDSGTYKLLLYGDESSYLESFEIDITAENLCSLEIIDIGSLECGVDTSISGSTTSSYGFENSVYYSFDLDSDSEIIINLDGHSSMYDPYILLFDSSQVYIETISYTQNYYINDYSIDLYAGQYYMVVTEDDPGFSNGTILEYAFSMSNNFQSTGAFTLDLFSYNGSCIEIIEGCENNNYFEYNPLANMDTNPSSCSTLIVEGCMDSTALNFSLLSNIDDNSCEQPTNLGVLDCGVDTLIYGATTSTYGIENSVYYTFKIDNDSEIIINLDGYSSMHYPYILLFDSTKNYIQTISYTSTYYINDYAINLEAGQNYLVITEDNPYFSDGTLSDYYSSIGNSYQGKGTFTLSLFTYDGICALHGCTNDWADNYDSLASINNGSCTLEACMSDWADNYDSNATSDDGSCYLEACMSYWANNYDSNATSDNGSCYRMGCMSDWADNYDALATINDGSCELVACMSDWADNYNVNATTDNGSCFKYGCINPTAFNYDPISTIDFSPTSCIIYGCIYNSFSNFNDLANVDDGSCNPFSEDVFGCIDEIAFNFDSLANIDNGGCIEVILGCMDYDYTEYNADANTDDSSCNTLVLEGCTDETSFNYNELANTDDGSCESVLEGCTDETAINFDPSENFNSVPCEYLTNLGNLQCGLDTIISDATTSSYGFENSVYYAFDLDNDSEMIINLDGSPTMYDPYIVLFDSTKNYIQTISYTQNYYINDYSINLESGQNYIVVTRGNPNFSAGTLSDYYTSMQNNYQNTGSFTLSLFPYDGTCGYHGCTDSTAFNFNPIATIDDELCEHQLDLGNIACNSVNLEDSLTNSLAFKYYQFEVSENSTFVFDATADVNIFLFDSTFNYIFKMDMGYNLIDLEIGEYYFIVSKENFLYSYSYIENIETLPYYSSAHDYELNIENLTSNCSSGCTESSAINFNQSANNFNNDSCYYPEFLDVINCDNNIIPGLIEDNFGAFNSKYFHFELSENSLYNFSVYSNSINGSIYQPYFLLFNNDFDFILKVSNSSPYVIDEYSIPLDMGGYYAVITDGDPGSNFTNLYEYFTDMKSNYQSSGTFNFEYSIINNSCPETDSEEFGEPDFIPECGSVYIDSISLINGIQTYEIREFNIANDSTLVEFEFEYENYWQSFTVSDFSHYSLLLFKNNELIHNFLPNTYYIPYDYEYYYPDYYYSDYSSNKNLLLNQGEYKIFIGGTYREYEASFQTIETASNSYLDYYESCHWTYQNWDYCGWCGTGCYPPIECMGFQNSNINLSLSINDNSCDYYGCMDQLAYNYSSWANIDDGSCEYLGCTQPDYLEYNPNANVDDGSCVEFPYGCTDEDGDGVCDEDEAATTCGDVSACNYSLEANDITTDIDNDLCIYPTAENLDCVGDCLNDTDADGVCDEDENIGCQDTAADNYDTTATDEGDCEYNGCMDINSCNFDSAANVDEGCEYPAADNLDCAGECLTDTDGDGVCDEDEVYGCSDFTACNFNYLVTQEDLSCVYPEIYYDCFGQCINDSDNDGVCDELELNVVDYGNIGEECNSEIEEVNLDPMIIQYSHWEDYWSPSPGPSFESAISFNVVTDSLILNLNIGNIGFYGGCILDGAYANVIFSISIYKDGNLLDAWDYNSVEGNDGCMMGPEYTTISSNINFPDQILVTQGNYELIFEVTESFFESASLSFSLLINDECISYGCNDTLACNYNPIANVNDNSCNFENNCLCNTSCPNCQNITLPIGWSIFSSYMIPNSLYFDDIMTDLNQNNQIIIAKDYLGNAYLPEWNFNGIGDAIIGHGYLVKTSNNCILNICGDYAYPESNTIFLNSGWNIIGYLRTEPANISLVFEEFTSTNNLIIAKDGLGNAFLPEWEFNGIGNMNPGQGYQLKINEESYFSFISNEDCYNDANYDCDGNLDIQIGDEIHGGIVFYIDSTGQHGLVASENDIGFYNGDIPVSIMQWGCDNIYVDTENQIGTGGQNSLNILEICDQENIAALMCLSYVSDQNFDDWYLPSKDELDLMINNVGQTSQVGNIINLMDDWYWSSSQISGQFAYRINASNGTILHDSKVNYNKVRPIRSF